MLRTRRGAYLGAAFVLGSFASWGTDIGASATDGDLLDRRFAAERLQTFSDYGGWEATFSVRGYRGEILVMTGLLCGEDFLSLVPKAARQIVSEGRFSAFECSLPERTTVVQVRLDL